MQFRVVGMEYVCTVPVPAVGNAGVGNGAHIVDKSRAVEGAAEDCAALSAVAWGTATASLGMHRRSFSNTSV